MPETIPGYYVWEVAGKAVSVQLNLEMIDRLSGVVLTGFGAIPRRGAEVGGILIGSIQDKVVKIDDFEAVPCSYKRGPSYQLSDADAAAFAEAWTKWKPGPGKTQYAVGFYRSNTRDKATVTDEDRQICSKYFPPPSNVMLFIKPYASKVSTAGFITYEKGKLDDQSALEFAFRRMELEGGSAPPRRPLGEARPEVAPRRRVEPIQAMAPPALEPAPDSDPAPPPPRREPRTEPAVPSFGAYAPPSPEREPEPERTYAVTTEARTRRKGWMWIPLSFIFLLLGVMLGFQAALSMYPQRGGIAGGGGDAYAIGLSVSKSDEHLHIKWDRQSQAIRSAPRGVLFIRDGDATKQVDLDSTQLQNGSVIYRRQGNAVQLRVELYPKDRVVISESVDWKE